MQNNFEIIDVVAGKHPVALDKCTARRAALVLPFAIAVTAAGAGVGLWSGEVAAFWLLVVGAAALWLGLNGANDKRMSSIFAVFALVGLAGVALVALSGNATVIALGAIMAGLARLGLLKIERRGWEHG